jgi:HEAT repeat protein
MGRLRAGPFCGLTFLDDDDAGLLLGRDAERARLLELAADRTLDTILVTGEVAAGKTSLLRAGLLPAAAGAKLLPLYLECGPRWDQRLRPSIADQLQRPISADDELHKVLAAAAAERDLRPLLILDPVEFLLWLEQPEVEVAQRLIAELRQVPQLGLILAVDRGNMHALGLLKIDAIPAEHTVTLGRWDRDQTARALEQTILAGGGYMEEGLPRIISEDLCADGPVLPAALQVVGHAAMLQRATTLHSYSRAGRALALISFYVEVLAARAGGARARRVLAVFADQASPRAALGVEEVSRRSGLAQPVTAQTLAALEEQGLLRHYSPLEPGSHLDEYAVLHPYLRQPIRDYVAPVNRCRAQAKLALRRRLHGRLQVLAPNEVLSVVRHLGDAIDARERALVVRSARIWLAAAALFIALPMLTLAITSVVAGRKAFLDDFAVLPGSPSVIERAGDPALLAASPLLPGWFGRVEVDSDIALSSLNRPLAAEIDGHRVSGRRASSLWLERLMPALPGARRAAFTLLAGRRSDGASQLLALAERPEERRRAIDITALLLGNSESTRAVLLRGMSDPRPDVRLLALRRARDLGGPTAHTMVERALKDVDSLVRATAMRSLRLLDPLAALPLLAPRLRDPDPRVQREALAQLTSAARRHPLAVLDILIDVGEHSSSVLSETVQQEIGRLQQQLLATDPRRLARHLVARLDRAGRPALRVALLQWLTSIAEGGDVSVVQPAVARLVKDRDVRVRSAALSLAVRFERPEAAMASLAPLAKAQQPRGEAVALRSAAATGLGLIKAPLDRERYNLLKALLRDRDTSVRGAAVRSMLRIGNLGLVELARVMKTGPADVAEAALQEVCSGPPQSARAATTVLAVAWKMKRQAMRQRAIDCARYLAGPSLRLRLWLADQASKDKDRQVRRAGAAAAALALREGGAGHVHLARIYLKDPDPELRVGLLEAIAARPPRSPGFLRGHIDRASKDGEPVVRAASARAVVAVGPPASAARSLASLARDPDGRVRRAALAAAERLDPAAIAPALESLDESLSALVSRGTPDEAREAVRLASRLHLLRTLRAGAAHGSGVVRAAALEAIVPHTPPTTLLPLLEAAMRESDADLRVIAMRAAARLGATHRPAIELLWRATFTADPTERFRAFAALTSVGGTGTSTALARIKQAARDASEERRHLAMAALGQLAHPDAEAAQIIVDGAEDPAHDVRLKAQAALAVFLARFSSLPALWELLQRSEALGLRRRIVVAALARQARSSGTAPLAARVRAMGASTPPAVRIAANLALALSRWPDPPERLLCWVYGWPEPTPSAPVQIYSEKIR